MTFRQSIHITAYALSGVIAAGVIVVLLVPIEPGPPPPVVGLDKIVHAFLFFAIALPILSVRPPAWVWLLPVLAAMGGVIELIQPFFGRGREFWDFIANIVGVLLAMPAGRAMYRVFSK